MAQSSLIQTRALGKQVRSGDSTLTLLHDISLDIAPGSAVAITGASGSGKSTLLGLLAGLDVPSSGQIRLLGEDLTSMTEDQRARLRAGRVGFVFQSFQLLPGLNALENVALPLELAANTSDSVALARDALTQVGLQQRLRHFPGQLSGGEQQRVALARAFVTRPQVLFADEPTGNLDCHTGEQIIELLFSLQRNHQATLVLVTHDEALAARCEQRYRIEDGRLVA